MISIQDNIVYLTFNKSLTDWLNTQYSDCTFVAVPGLIFRPVSFPYGKEAKGIECDTIDIPVSLCSPSIAFEDASTEEVETLVRNLVEWLLKESEAEIFYLNSLEGRVKYLDRQDYISKEHPGLGLVGIEWTLRGVVD